MKSKTNSNQSEYSATQPKSPSRREFISKTGKIVAGSALAGVALPSVYAGEDNTIRIALVGCGGRGSGAVKNALSSDTGPTKLVAMADVYEDKMKQSFDALSASELKRLLRTSYDLVVAKLPNKTRATLTA